MPVSSNISAPPPPPANATSPPALAPISAHSPLTGRAQAQRPDGPRARILQRLRHLFSTITRRFQPAPATCKRFEKDAGERLNRLVVKRVAYILCQCASDSDVPVDIADALDHAARTAHHLTDHELTATLVDVLQKANQASLLRMLNVMRSAAATEVRARIPDQATGDRLDLIQPCVEQALVRAVVADRIKSAKNAVEHARPTQSTQLLREALEGSTVTLAAYGLRPDPREQFGLVVQQLKALEPWVLAGLLHHAHTDDLVRLSEDLPLRNAVNKELLSRTGVLATRLRQQARSFTPTHDDPAVFVRELAEMAATLEELQVFRHTFTYLKVNGRPCESLDPLPDTQLLPIQKQIESLAAAVLGKSHFHPGALSDEQLVSLSRSLRSLGAKDLLDSVALQSAQQECLHRLYEEFKNSFERPAPSDGEPNALLKHLEQLADATRSFAQATAAFNTDHRPDPHLAQSDLVMAYLRSLPEQARAMLRMAFAHAQSAALIGALRTGETLAREIHDERLADRFASMARLAGTLTGEASGSSPPMPTSELGQALHDAYGLVIAADGHATLLLPGVSPITPAEHDFLFQRERLLPFLQSVRTALSGRSTQPAHSIPDEQLFLQLMRKVIDVPRADGMRQPAGPGEKFDRDAKLRELQELKHAADRIIPSLVAGTTPKIVALPTDSPTLPAQAEAVIRTTAPVILQALPVAQQVQLIKALNAGAVRGKPLPPPLHGALVKMYQATRLDPDFVAAETRLRERVVERIMLHPRLRGLLTQAWSAWRTMDMAARMELLRGIIEVHCECAGFQPPNEVVADSIEENVLAQWWSQPRLICFNKDAVDFDDFEATLDSAYHENSHAYQYALTGASGRLIQPDPTGARPSLATQTTLFAANIPYQLSSKKGYFEQPIEAHAYMAAQHFARDLCRALMLEELRRPHEAPGA
ncbi:MAG: hypothetical protein WDO68_03960 [Gammaproteobacteria bacterium]